MKSMRTVLIICLLTLLVTPGQVWAGDDYDEIINSLMCPACLSHGEILANGVDGGAEQAKEDIKQRLAAGQTKEEIINAYVSMYGEQILAVPTKSGFNLLAWVIPPMAAAGGIGLVYFAISRWVRNHSVRPEPKAGPAVDAVDEERLQEEMRKYL